MLDGLGEAPYSLYMNNARNNKLRNRIADRLEQYNRIVGANIKLIDLIKYLRSGEYVGLGCGNKVANFAGGEYLVRASTWDRRKLALTHAGRVVAGLIDAPLAEV